MISSGYMSYVIVCVYTLVCIHLCVYVCM
jgi:hypothetical protein